MLLGLLHKAGCYVESDPIGLQDRLNTYGYVSANLLLKTDPRGLIEWSAMYGVTRTGLGRFGAAVKIRLLILLVMLLLDVTYFYIFIKWVRNSIKIYGQKNRYKRRQRTQVYCMLYFCKELL